MPTFRDAAAQPLNLTAASLQRCLPAQSGLYTEQGESTVRAAPDTLDVRVGSLGPKDSASGTTYTFRTGDGNQPVGHVAVLSNGTTLAEFQSHPHQVYVYGRDGSKPTVIPKVDMSIGSTPQSDSSGGHWAWFNSDLQGIRLVRHENPLSHLVSSVGLSLTLFGSARSQTVLSPHEHVLADARAFSHCVVDFDTTTGTASEASSLPERTQGHYVKTAQGSAIRIDQANFGKFKGHDMEFLIAPDLLT
ncbi:MAG TPA: hypothetical protein VGO93_22480 [Candidatus Xenobia bacterium]|jgi:hypothetical protein